MIKVWTIHNKGNKPYWIAMKLQDDRYILPAFRGLWLDTLERMKVDKFISELQYTEARKQSIVEIEKADKVLKQGSEIIDGIVGKIVKDCILKRCRYENGL